MNFVSKGGSALRAGLVFLALTGLARAEDATNLLHIGQGAIALPDPGEDQRHWSGWTINLIDGSHAYGWVSAPETAYPHTIRLELAGVGRLSALVFDTRFEAVEREDGSRASEPVGAPVRHVEVWGAAASEEGPYGKILDAEIPADQRTRLSLPKPVDARWLKLVIRDNWAGGGQSRLSEVEAIGTFVKRVTAPDQPISAYYTHEYGGIALTRKGPFVTGCYNDGAGLLSGLLIGRVMRLAWAEPGERHIGMATLVAAHGDVYGFWFRDGDRMGSPWNSHRVSRLEDADLGKCRAVLLGRGGDKGLGK